MIAHKTFYLVMGQMSIFFNISGNRNQSLSTACQNGDEIPLFNLYLVKGADIILCLKTGIKSLVTARRNGHNSIVGHLLSKGADFIL